MLETYCSNTGTILNKLQSVKCLRYLSHHCCPKLDKSLHALYTQKYMVEQIAQHTKQYIDPPTPDEPIPMIGRAFQLLDVLMVSEEGLSLSDLARTLHMSKGSMHRLLKTLEDWGVVEQHKERLYVLGPRIYKLAAYVRGPGLRRLSLQAMQRLAADIGETVFLARIEQDSILVIESIEAGAEYSFPHVSVPRGTRIPLPAGTTGRLVFASWSLEQRQTWLRTHSLPRFTEHSITAPAQFLAAVEETIATGLAIDFEEYLAGVNAVAVPILGDRNSLVAMLCILGFSSYFDRDALEHAGDVLLEEAENISRSLR
jgi:DNA-binding IclR family transcriptional regulator